MREMTAEGKPRNRSGEHSGASMGEQYCSASTSSCRTFSRGDEKRKHGGEKRNPGEEGHTAGAAGMLPSFWQQPKGSDPATGR